MNENKNPNLPANAVPTVAVKAGMNLLRDGRVVTVSSVRWMGFTGVVRTECGLRIRVNSAGTMRLA